MQDKPTESGRIYWPGSNTPISRNNEFNWRGKPSRIADADPTYRVKGKRGPVTTGFAANHNTLYGLSSKANARLMDAAQKPHNGAYSKASGGGK